jgi:hypothetical protein
LFVLPSQFTTLVAISLMAVRHRANALRGSLNYQSYKPERSYKQLGFASTTRSDPRSNITLFFYIFLYFVISVFLINSKP